MPKQEDIAFAHITGKSVRTLVEGFQETVHHHPDAVALRTPGSVQEITWREYGERVAKIAAGLAALGVGRGDTVGLMVTNRPEFHLVDTAALHLGAIPFSIYNTSSPDQIKYLFDNAENRVVVTEHAFIDRIKQADTGVEHVICVDGPATGATTLAEVEENPAPDFDFAAAWAAARPDDVVTLIYTSGTTGPPKGVEMTHTNVLAQLNGLDALDIRFGDRVVSYLPAAHIADRITAHYGGMLRGVEVTSIADPREIAAALPDARPNTFFGVPRVWQKMKAGIEAKVLEEQSPAKQRLAAWAFDVGIRAARADLASRPRGAVLNASYRVADQLVLGKIRHALGLDLVRVPASGAAPIPVEVLEYFYGLGIRIVEVWGLSETAGVTTMTDQAAPKLGSVGKPIPGAEIKLGADGELMVRGPIVTRGYRNQPEKTAQAIDSDGWLATGDIATIGADGNVTIIDRKKELLITEAGKNISPTNIENAMKAASSLVGQAVAIGDGKPYITALIVLDPDAAAARAKLAGIPDADPATLAARPEIRDEVIAAVRTGNAKLSRVEQIKRFVVLGQTWEPGGDELTPKGSLKRKPIATKYAAERAALYADPPTDTVVDLG